MRQVPKSILLGSSADAEIRKIKSVSWGTCSYINFASVPVEPINKPIPEATTSEQIQRYFEGEDLSGLQVTPRRRNIQYESVEELFASEFGEGPLKDQTPAPCVPVPACLTRDFGLEPDYKMQLTDRPAEPPSKIKKREKAATNTQIRKGLGTPRKILLQKLQNTFGHDAFAQTFVATGRKLSPLNSKPAATGTKGHPFKPPKATLISTRGTSTARVPTSESSRSEPRVMQDVSSPLNRKKNPLRLMAREGAADEVRGDTSQQILLFDQGLLLTLYISEENHELVSVEVYSGSDGPASQRADDLAAAARKLLGTVVSPENSLQGLEQVHLRLRRLLQQKENLFN